jgi:hypothetical protein
MEGFEAAADVHPSFFMENSGSPGDRHFLRTSGQTSHHTRVALGEK